MLILSVGAILNIIINYNLIPVLGIEGASIATLTGYIVSDIICVIVLCKMNLMVVSKRFIMSVILIIIFMILWRFLFTDNIIIGTTSAVVLTLLLIVMYKKDIVSLFIIRKNKS